MSSRAALITAAGASQRMGQPKAIMCFPNGTSFISHMAATLSQCGYEQIYLSLPDSALAPAFQSHLKPFGVKTIFNPNPDHQQIGSILQLLHELGPSPTSVLVWPVDTPFADQTHINTLHQTLAKHADSGLVTLEVDGVGGHPLLLGAPFFPHLEEFGQNGGLRGLAQQFPQQVHRVKHTDKRLCTNINTPEEYQKAFDAVPQFLPNSLYFMQ